MEKTKAEERKELIDKVVAKAADESKRPLNREQAEYLISELQDAINKIQNGKVSQLYLAFVTTDDDLVEVEFITDITAYVLADSLSQREREGKN